MSAMKMKFLLILFLSFLTTKQVFACGGCVDSGSGYLASAENITSFLKEEAQTSLEILREAIIVGQAMAVEKTNDLALQKIETIEKESVVNGKKEIFLLEQQNRLEGIVVDVKATSK